MEENLLQVPSGKKEIKVPELEKIDALSWNLCGGSFMIGCWFGCCLLPLIQVIKQRDTSN